MRRTLPVWLAAAALFAAAPARAEENDEAEDSAGRAYWTIAFFGGVLSPLGDSADTRQSGLVATARLGWTSRIGLGANAEISYSPLPHVVPPELGSIESHLLAALASARFTAGRDTFRAWASAGGGLVFQRTRTEDLAKAAETSTDFSPAAGAALGLEMHFFPNGGLSLAASGLKAFGDAKLDLYALTAGLVFVFR